MGKKILIVDDQPGIRLLLRDVFSSQNYTVKMAETGQQAIDLIYAEQFDLLILDYHLPIMNGRDIIKQMRENRINVPIILMSGLVENIDHSLIEGYLSVEVMAKPFNIHDILAVAKKLLQ